MKFLKPVTKVTKTIILGVGTTMTIGFASMLGVASNETFKISTSKIIGIGSQNYNKYWDDKNKEFTTNEYKDYFAFLDQIQKNSNQALVNAVNQNHALWITGIVFTAIGITTFGLACYLLMFTEDRDKDGSIAKKAAEMERLNAEYQAALKDLNNSDEDAVIIKEEIEEEK